MKGSLEVICGPMFCGKTEELLRRLRRAEIAKQSTVILKPRMDFRFGETKVVSRSGVEAKAVPAIAASHALGYKHTPAVVAFDEAQFFGIEIVSTVNELVERGARVIVSGLDQDFRQQPFGQMPQLLAMADEVTKLKAVCMKCGGDATTTQRLISGKPASYNDETILIGDTEAYEARCRNCHEKE